VKKLCLILCITVCFVKGVTAQELNISGEVKTGFYWEEKQIGNSKPTSEGRMHNNDDAGIRQGRFRLNLHYVHDTFGVKIRFQQENDWLDNTAPGWGYAFAYGNFFDNQFKLSAGKMGDSPWAAGGPEMWTELDTRIGIRAEFMPNFLPGLNVGFVLNDMDGTVPLSQQKEPTTILNMLEESVVGASYTHDLFAFRFAYRFDSLRDEGTGGQLLYRLEEHALQNYLPGFQIWANGYYAGIGDETWGSTKFINWLYFQYEPQDFTAQLRLGYDIEGKRAHVFYLRPIFYYHLFDRFLSVGLRFSFGQEFGEDSRNPGKDYLFWEIQPMLRLNFGSAYVAFVYQYSSDYKFQDADTMENVETKHQWINLRVVFTF
jgi:hypothetical protein